MRTRTSANLPTLPVTQPAAAELAERDPAGVRYAVECEKANRKYVVFQTYPNLETAASVRQALAKVGCPSRVRVVCPSKP